MNTRLRAARTKLSDKLKNISLTIYSYFFFAAVVIIKIVSGIGQTKFNQNKFYRFLKIESSPLTSLLTMLAIIGSFALTCFLQVPALARLFKVYAHKEQTILKSDHSATESELKLGGRIFYRVLQPINFISGIFKASNFFLFSMTFLETITPVVGHILAKLMHTTYHDNENPETFRALSVVQITALTFFMASICSFIAFEQRKANANVKEIALKIQKMIEESRFDFNKEKLTALVAGVLNTLPGPALAFITTRSSLETITKVLSINMPQSILKALSFSAAGALGISNLTTRMPSFYRLLKQFNSESARKSQNGLKRKTSTSTKLVMGIFISSLALDTAATAASHSMGVGTLFAAMDMNEKVALALAIICGISNAGINASLLYEAHSQNFSIANEDRQIGELQNEYDQNAVNAEEGQSLPLMTSENHFNKTSKPPRYGTFNSERGLSANFYSDSERDEDILLASTRSF